MFWEEDDVTVSHTEGQQAQQLLTSGFQYAKVPQKASANVSQNYRSFGRFISMAIILAISSFQFGYVLCQISTVPPSRLKQYYHIKWDQDTTMEFLVGIMPIGGILGCLFNRLFLIWFSRKNAHFVVSAMNVVSAVLIQINYVEAIMVGRFLLGVCCGIYTAIAPQYIKEVAPVKLRTLMGSFFSLGRVFGIVVCYALGVIFFTQGVRDYYRIVFAVPGVLAVAQSLLIFLLVPDSPVEMLEQRRFESLREYVAEFYRPEAVDSVVSQYTAEFEAQQSAAEAAKAAEDPSYADALSPNRRRAFAMAVHLNVYRQLIGVNTIVAFAGLMIGKIDKGLAVYADLLLNLIQLVFTVASTFWLGNLFGRRPLYLVSGAQLALCNLLMAFGYLLGVHLLVIIPMLLYMVVFGLLFAPVSWSYPTEITAAANNTMATAFTWVALAVTTVVPPVVMDYMDDNAYPIFFFFAGYTMLSLVYMYSYLVETKGMTYKQIIERY